MHTFWLVITASLTFFWAAVSVVVIRGMAGLPRIWKSALAADADCPPVSILIAARDEAEGVRESVLSMLAQDYTDFQVVVADDRSTDATPQILDAMARRDHRLKVIHLHELPAGWLGKPHALTVASQYARGEWLALADADARWAPEAPPSRFALHSNSQMPQASLWKLQGG